MGLEQQGVEYEDIEALNATVPFIIEGYRKARILEINEKTTIIRCFTGSSKFNKKEFGELIDWFIRFCHQLQIPTMQYKNEWEGLYK